MIESDIGNRREDALVAAGEPRHEVRLDEAEHDAAVGFDVIPIHRTPAGRPAGANRRQSRRVMRIVVHDPHAPENLVADHGPQFVRSIRAMRARPVHDDQVIERHMAELLEHPRKQPVAWAADG